MPTFITKSGSKVIILTATARYAVKTTSFFWNADTNVIRIFGKNLPDQVLLYADLRINGIQPTSQADANAKLNALFPDVAGAINIPATTASTQQKMVGVHVVVSLSRFAGTELAQATLLKSLGINLIWLHNDDYDPAAAYFKDGVDAWLTACETLGGIWCTVGVTCYADTGANTATIKTANMIKDTFNRAGMYRVNGRPVYTFYGYVADVATGSLTFNQFDLNDNLLSSKGIYKEDWILVAHTNWPYSYDNGVNWRYEPNTPSGLELTGNRGIKRFSTRGFYSIVNGVAPEYNITHMQHLLSVWPWVEGLATFAGDLTQQQILDDNREKSKVAKRKGLAGGHFASIGFFYASYSFYDYGFAGLIQKLDAILSQPVDERPAGLHLTTYNDDVEYSRMIGMPGFTAGIRYLPTPGTYIGNTIPTPLLDRSGAYDFIRPSIDAYKNNLAAPVFTEMAMFCNYMLHPKGVGFTSTIPAAAVTAGYNQTQWDTMIYKVGNHTIDDGAGHGIKFMANVDNIGMGAHLLQPCYLRINGSISALKPAGYAYHSIAIGSFTGLPLFEIIASDGATVIGSAYGDQPINQTTSWPGGWGKLCKKMVNTIS